VDELSAAVDEFAVVLELEDEGAQPEKAKKIGIILLGVAIGRLSSQRGTFVCLAGTMVR
jgi:hypothetical protein